MIVTSFKDFLVSISNLGTSRETYLLFRSAKILSKISMDRPFIKSSTADEDLSFGSKTYIDNAPCSPKYGNRRYMEFSRSIWPMN